ncbi:MAG: chloride channel protein [Phycisphaeraceae bacterium]|nr:chloride channel protein [Phycisphaeraceae bacterium]
MAAAVGLAAGLGAIVFHLMCVTVTHYALGVGGGYEPGGPVNEREFGQIFEGVAAEEGVEAGVGAAGARGVDAEETRGLRPGLAESAQGERGADAFATASGEDAYAGGVRWWLLPVIAGVGGLASAVVVYTMAPSAEGHGTDSAIEAYHQKQGFIPAMVPLAKMISSAITLGTGGSGGREGPISQIGAGVGSFLATRLRLPDSERRVLMAAGIGAGIGAIFHAPLAGAMFATEVLYSDPDFESEVLIPAFIATTVAYCVYGLAFGFMPLFEVHTIRAFNNPFLLMPLTVLAVVMVAGSWAYVRGLYAIEGWFKRMKLPRVLRPAVGAVATAVVAVAGYWAFRWFEPGRAESSLSVLGIGYGFLQDILVGQSGASVGLIALLLFVGLGKIVTTSLTIGSGGSAGTFGPSMVIGGALGAVVGLAFQWWLPGLMPDATHVVAFAILGMASFFAAAGKTPLSALILVSEVTASYQLLLPAMWVCALAYLLSRNWTLYHKQVANRLESPAHRADFVIDVLQGVKIQDALPRVELKFVTVPMGEPLSAMTHLVTDTRQTCFPVVDGEGKYYGLFSLSDIREYLYDAGGLAELAVAQDLADVKTKPLTLQTDLATAVGQFVQGSFEELPVVDEARPGEVIGLLRRVDVIAAYSGQLLKLKGPGGGEGKKAGG